MPGYYPKSRREGLTTEPLLDEVLVYDDERKKAYCLNAAAAVVYELADGTRSIEALAEQLAARSEVPADPSVVWFCLDELDRQGLIETTGAPTATRPAPTRRELITRLGLTAAVLPAVLAISLPRPAYAQTPGPTGAAGR